MSRPLDNEYMAHALRLARRAWYTTLPNPRVGCVLVKQGEVVGEGWHEYAGEAHAEVNALKQAGERARGATAYVTLEPCAHHGRTGPCSQALVEAGVSRVVVAMRDPNPLVAGRGLAQLREAGIEVEEQVLGDRAEALNPGFIRRMRGGRPLVRVKIAASLDGRTAMASGESKWITGAEARRDVHLLRAASGAVLTAVGTALADDPSLNVRLDANDGDPRIAAALKRREPPLRVVLDSHLRLSPGARMLSLAGETLVFHALDGGEAARAEALSRAGACLISAPGEDGQVDLAAVLSELARREVNEVLVEAGATLNGRLLQAGLVDELLIYFAPHLMGDAARPMFHLPELRNMAQRLELEIVDTRAVGRDWRIRAVPRTSAGSTGESAPQGRT